MVGNKLMDTLRYNHDRWTRPACLDGIEDGRYLVFTINRKALLADEDNLKRMLAAVTEVAGDIPVIAPLRGRALETVKILNSPRNATLSKREFSILNSLSYLDFGYLTSHAMGIITDSGNVAEEATFNHVPCITLNSYTEHSETVKQGTNVLVGEDADKLRSALKEMVSGQWKASSLPDRWDGRTAERIVQILMA
jgi:UDP-N-acetylglucosamine 2-epimerase (non-hydrolysing)